MSAKRKEHKIVDGVELKHCCKCDVWKKLTDFHNLCSTWDGLLHKCKACVSLHMSWLRKRDKKYALKLDKRHKEWIKKHPGYERLYKKEEIKRKGGPVYQRRLDLKKIYGITPEKYMEMFNVQKGRCKICGKKQKERQLGIDHCHKTKKVRGLLCISCNLGIGHLRDSAKLLKEAIKYLENNSG